MEVKMSSCILKEQQSRDQTTTDSSLLMAPLPPKQRIPLIPFDHSYRIKLMSLLLGGQGKLVHVDI